MNTSLDEIEHGILWRSKCKLSLGYFNKIFKSRFEKAFRVDKLDYRIHFALNCGAPEMNPDFRWFVAHLSARRLNIIVRCNLTIIRANKKYQDLPQFFKQHGVEVVSSLPFYTKDRTDRQHGDGVFEDSIRSLQMLNEVGYGVGGTDLKLNLVYNPAGAFLPQSQEALEREYKAALAGNFGITFNSLYAITNLPISRYLDYLSQSGNYEKYMSKLIGAFNPTVGAKVMSMIP